MDIRIGNDIRLNVAISDFNILEGETIRCAHCFLMNAAEKNLSNVDPKPEILPTKYTLRHGDARIYNVLPINAQVRPCDGPGFFGKSLRQYGHKIFTSVDETAGYIYGFFQEYEQLVLGDYYLVVMLVLERNGFGIRNRRHIVANYGYVFTLTMDGATVDPNGIGSFVQVKPKNVITLNVPSSAMLGTEVTLDGTTKYGGTITFSAVDIDGDVVSIADNKFTIAKNTIVTAVSTSGDMYDADTVTKTVVCTEPSKYAYYGSSVGVPVTIDTAHYIQLPGTVSITTTESDHKNCHWVAYPAGFSCTNIVDSDDLSVESDYVNQTTIDGFIVKYFMDPEYSIIDTTKFIISKVS